MKKLFIGMIIVFMILGATNVSAKIKDKQSVRIIIQYNDEILVKENETLSKIKNEYTESENILAQALGVEIESAMVIEHERHQYLEVITLQKTNNTDIYIYDLKAIKGVEHVEIDHELELFQEINDPYYENQWYIGKTKLDKAWTQIENPGTLVTIAVLDTGIDENHEDLSSKILANGYNFGDNNQSLTDYAGHGTAVAGVIAAQINNNLGIAGVVGNQNIKILPLKIQDFRGSMYVSYAVLAIDYAIEQKVDIINISSGSDYYSEVYNQAIQKAINNGIIVVASAGNGGHSGNPLFYPATFEGVISVGSTDVNDEVSIFSEHNEYVDFVAPGEDILTTIPNDDYMELDGTSFSAPYVAGICGIIKSIKSDYNSQEIQNLLEETALDLGEEGKDNYYGNGRINPLEIIEKLNISSDDLLNENWVQWMETKIVESNKIWTVDFNQKLNIDTINNSNIFIISEDNEKIDIDLNVQSNGKSIEVSSVNLYEKGKMYTLYISKNIENFEGTLLNESTKIIYTIN